MIVRDRESQEVVVVKYLCPSDEPEWDLFVDDMADFLLKFAVDAEISDFDSFITIEGEDANRKGFTLDVQEDSYVVITNGTVTTLSCEKFWEKYEGVTNQ